MSLSLDRHFHNEHMGALEGLIRTYKAFKESLIRPFHIHFGSSPLQHQAAETKALKESLINKASF